MTDNRDERTISTLKKLTAEWLNQTMPTGVLVTVTGFNLSRDHEHATVLVSVFPENREQETEEIFRKHGHELHDYLGKHVRTRQIPFVKLAVDLGEKNRQQVEKLIAEDKK